MRVRSGVEGNAMLTLQVLSLALALIQSPPATATRVDLSGTWAPDLNSHQREREMKGVIDPNGPKAPLPPPGGLLFLPRVRVVDEGASLAFEYIEDDGKPISSLRVTTDGKENLNPRAGSLLHTSKSRREGRSLKTDWRLTREGAEVMTGLDTWTLSDDGTTLTQTSAMEDSRSKSRTKTTYRRK
jgi:hypothetical protein